MEKKNYRFRSAEIEAMKKSIESHCESEREPDERGNKSAWRLRLCFEGRLMCCRNSKRKKAQLERELELYKRLTVNDMPNWYDQPTNAAQPAETPQISTETAEVDNASAEGETTAEMANASHVNVTQMVKSELAKNKAMRATWHLELSDGTQFRVRYNYTLPEPYGDQYIYEELSPKDGHACFSVTCDEKYIINEVARHLTESPETPPAKDLSTEPEKTPQTANKPQNPTIPESNKAV